MTNTIGLPPSPSFRAALRISRARPQSGTRVLARGLHPARGNRPHTRVPIDLAPHRPTDLAATRRRQHQELERQRVHFGWIRRAHPLNGRRHFPMGQGPPVLDDIALGPSTGKSRSHGLSVRQSMAMAYSSTARMRKCTVRAVGAFACQMGVRISSTSALVTSETGTSPMRGKAWSSRLRSQFLG